MNLYRFVRFLHCVLALGCWVLAPSIRAVQPPPDGGYPNGITAEGDGALSGSPPPENDTAVGYHAMHNLSGVSNNHTAAGSLSLSVTSHIGGYDTAAVGFQALLNGVNDLTFAVGHNALISGGVGLSNVGMGESAFANGSGYFNVAAGSGALQNNIGDQNCAFGAGAMQASQSASNNVAFGRAALLGCNGSENVALGAYALDQLTDSSSNNIAIGYRAGHKLRSNADLNIEIGNQGTATDSSIIRIGDTKQQTSTFIAGIQGATVASGVPVVINTVGRLGTVTSSARYKVATKPMGQSSEVLYQLQPVKFRYKKELDPKGIPQFGLVAEEVEKVAPELVAHDQRGKPYSVRYQAVNAMMLNEFQKEVRIEKEQDATLKVARQNLDQLEARVARLQATIEEQSAQLRQIRD